MKSIRRLYRIIFVHEKYLLINRVSIKYMSGLDICRNLRRQSCYCRRSSGCPKDDFIAFFTDSRELLYLLCFTFSALSSFLVYILDYSLPRHLVSDLHAISLPLLRPLGLAALHASFACLLNLRFWPCQIVRLTLRINILNSSKSCNSIS